ncbi:MAG: septum formation initiator family protein [Bacteroidales bacterium]
MKTLRILVYIIRNKYIVASMVFFTWLFVFDKNNLLSQVDLARKLHQLKDDKKYYMEQIRKDKIETNELLTNPENLEKFARERYLMKKDSEDIFLIVRQDSVQQKSK